MSEPFLVAISVTRLTTPNTGPGEKRRERMRAMVHSSRWDIPTGTCAQADQSRLLVKQGTMIDATMIEAQAARPKAMKPPAEPDGEDAEMPREPAPRALSRSKRLSIVIVPGSPHQ